MNIVYINTSITNSGGMERILANKVNLLVERGYDVTIISMLKLEQEPFFTIDKRVKLVSLGFEKSELGEKYLSRFLDKVSTILVEQKADITISMDLGLSRYIYMLNDGSKKIIETHFSRFKRKNRYARFARTKLGKIITPLLYRKRERLLAKFDAFVVLTEEDKMQWPNAKNIVVIPNMITVPIIDKEPNYSSNKIIGVGRFTGQKAWEYMVHIWSRIADKHPDWEVHIYGGGHKKNKLKKQIESLNLQDSFKLHDPIPNIEIAMLESSISVLTSRYEGFGLVLSEAMSVGVPCVSFACKCGPSDIIKNNIDGILVPCFELDTFAKELEKLMDSKSLRTQMGVQAKENMKRFYPNEVMSKWELLFNEILDI